MLKRKPTTQYTKEGKAMPQEPEPVDVNISTPEEIKARKIYRVKRQVPPPVAKNSFILQSKLVPDGLEEKLLEQVKSAPIDFFSIHDEEIKEISPEKKVKSSQADEKVLEEEEKKPEVSAAKYSNPFSSILQSIETKKEDELVSSFISSSTPKIEQILTPVSFAGTTQKSTFDVLVSIEAEASVEHVQRGIGFIEIAIGKVTEKKMSSVIFKNQIKNIIYQAVLTGRSEFKECKDWELGEDDGKNVELEIEVYIKKIGKVVKENLRVQIAKSERAKLEKSVEQARAYLNSN